MPASTGLCLTKDGYITVMTDDEESEKKRKKKSVSDPLQS
jgi:hypothetical protein